MDFFEIRTCEARGKEGKEGVIEVYPDFKIGRSKDLMIRGKSFYAVWDEENNIWSTDEYDVQRFVDKLLHEHAAKLEAEGVVCKVKPLQSQDSGRWDKFQKFVKSVSDNSHELDAKVIFANTEVKKTDYATKRLPYAIGKGSIDAYEELISLLYDEKERAKFEWAFGAIISGDSKKIEKFLVFHGRGGTGKSTVMRIAEMLFEGYWVTFDVQDLVGNSNNFAMESFKDNPLVAIQHDTDLSRIEDNSRLNSVISHEPMQINQKFKSIYQSKVNAFVFIGTNKPVKISDAKSGLIRRLIDVYPTGEKHKYLKYKRLMRQIPYELGAIAQHCLDVYHKMGGSGAYADYEPTKMMFQTNVFRNYIEAYYDVFKIDNGTTLKNAYRMYKEYCDESEIKHKLPLYRFREELRNYFDGYKDRHTVDGHQVHSWFYDFTVQPYKTAVDDDDEERYALTLEETESVFDLEYETCPAQYGKPDETPRKFWDNSERLIDGVLKKPRQNQIVDTVLSDIDTSMLHFVKVPSNHVVIDFDLRGPDGEKSLQLNLEAASELPPTYAEISKSGSGVHLHYLYAGDVAELDNVFADGIEVKVFTGNSSLRRRLTRCNDMPIATLSGGLPLKKEKKVLQADIVDTEKNIRTRIEKNLNKEYHPGTKPSIDFIATILQNAYDSGAEYDVTDLKSRIIEFAAKSTNQSLKCLKIVKGMKFKSKISEEIKDEEPLTIDKLFPTDKPHDDRLIFFDVEVYPNLLVICWVDDVSDEVVRMINPTATQIEELLRFKLIGFNCRRYDNHVIYARLMGASIEDIYRLSQRLINKEKDATYGKAYGLSYADVWCMNTDKQGLKKWQIQLGLPHMEMDIPWDQPVPDDKIKEVTDYCANDVLSTRSVFHHNKQDYMARQILAELSGKEVSDTTPAHMTKLVFGSEPPNKQEFVYTDLSEMFKGYVYDFGKSTYRGEEVGEGGYVYAEPGIYENVTLLDVASMHPTSIIELNLFGKYTANFAEMMAARLAIKNGNLQAAAELFGGRLTPYLGNEEDLNGLSDALKIAINTVYGLTSAGFDNSFRDPRNKDNIVAKRGALFMIDLKHAVQEKGFTVAHIKTDSIKIPNATPEIIEFIKDFGKKYGYTFEHEATYKKFCLVNDAVYIARVGWTQKKGNVDFWSATGAQFKHPYVFKTLFSQEPVTFKDLCETKSVMKGAIYLDFNPEEATPNEPEKKMRFIGKTGLFVPVEDGPNSGVLLRVMEGNPKPYAVAGTKGYFWAEADVVKSVNNIDDSFFSVEWANRPNGFKIDLKYFEKLADEAKKAVGQFGDFEEFVK